VGGTAAAKVSHRRKPHELGITSRRPVRVGILHGRAGAAEDVLAKSLYFKYLHLNSNTHPPLTPARPSAILHSCPACPRIQQQAICYHLYNRSINRYRLFEDERDFAGFRQIIGRYKHRCACLVYHWALMPNHYHLLIRLTFPMLRRFAAGIQQSYAQYHHRCHGTCGVLWQGRYQTRAVEEDLCLTRWGRYIERNPVRAGLAEFAWDWRHSSAGFYVLGRADALTDLDVQFAPGDLDAARRAEYSAMLQDNDEQRWVKEQSGLAIGSTRFFGSLEAEAGHRRRRRGRPAKADAGISV